MFSDPAGFKELNLVEVILNLGYKVKGLDNHSTRGKKNVEEFIDNAAYEFIEGDIKYLDVCMKDYKYIDFVLH